MLSTAPGTWEGPLIEAPTMISSPSGVQLFYSANPFETPQYAVGVARCDGPTGPCSRIYTNATPGNPIRDGRSRWTDAVPGRGGKLADGVPLLDRRPTSATREGLRTLRFLPLTFPGGLPQVG